MSKEQLDVLLSRLKSDTALVERIQNAAHLEETCEIAQQAGFDVEVDDWLRFQQEQADTSELSDEELEAVAGGVAGCTDYNNSRCCCVKPIQKNMPGRNLRPPGGRLPGGLG